MRNDFVVELDNCVIKTSPYASAIFLVVELDNCVIKTSPYASHTGNPVPRSTSLLNRILVGGRDDDEKQPRFQTAWFLGLISGSDEVIALHPECSVIMVSCV